MSIRTFTDIDLLVDRRYIPGWSRLFLFHSLHVSSRFKRGDCKLIQHKNKNSKKNNKKKYFACFSFSASAACTYFQKPRFFLYQTICRATLDIKIGCCLTIVTMPLPLMKPMPLHQYVLTHFFPFSQVGRSRERSSACNLRFSIRHFISPQSDASPPCYGLTVVNSTKDQKQIVFIGFLFPTARTLPHPSPKSQLCTGLFYSTTPFCMCTKKINRLSQVDFHSFLLTTYPIKTQCLLDPRTLFLFVSAVRLSGQLVSTFHSDRAFKTCSPTSKNCNFSMFSINIRHCPSPTGVLLTPLYFSIPIFRSIHPLLVVSS